MIIDRTSNAWTLAWWGKRPKDWRANAYPGLQGIMQKLNDLRRFATVKFKSFTRFYKSWQVIPEETLYTGIVDWGSFWFFVSNKSACNTCSTEWVLRLTLKLQNCCAHMQKYRQCENVHASLFFSAGVYEQSQRQCRPSGHFIVEQQRCCAAVTIFV